MTLYLQFISIIQIDMTEVVEILPHPNPKEARTYST